MNKQFFWIFISFFISLRISAQVSVAIGGFENRSDRMYLDAWTGKIPDYLQHELSGKPGLVLVERDQLQTILQEQTLSMTGLTDSARVQEAGRLISAQYVITGTISRDQGWYRIDARVINTATGKVITEKVESRDRTQLSKMAALLADNLSFQLTGVPDYRARMKIRQYPVKPFLAATLAGGITAGAMHVFYQNERRDYQSAHTLAAFESEYNSANRLYKTRNILIGVTGAAAIGTLICYLKNVSPEEILASRDGWTPYVMTKPGETIVGLQIHF